MQIQELGFPRVSEGWTEFGHNEEASLRLVWVTLGRLHGALTG